MELSSTNQEGELSKLSLLTSNKKVLSRVLNVEMLQMFTDH